MSRSDEQPEIRLASFLRANKKRIIETWQREVRALPGATGMDRATLIDFVPPLLDGVTEAIEHAGGGESYSVHTDRAEKHALDRLREGFDLDEIVLELSLLRDCILRLWSGSSVSRDARILHQVIDQSMASATKRYSNHQQQVLRVLDRISHTALHADSLQDLLQRLVDAFQAEVPSVDTAVILLRQGDELVVRASAGVPEELDPPFSLPIGQGFAGTVAQSKEPLQITLASQAEMVKSDALKSHDLRALYGIPLLDGDNVVGVAHIGSETAHFFSRQDRLLLESMATRATAAIHRHMLTEATVESARLAAIASRRFKATFDNAAVGIAHVALDGQWLRVNRRFCDIVGRTPDELRGANFYDLAAPDETDFDLRQLLGLGHDAHDAELRIRHADGHTIWVDLAVSVVHDDDGHTEYVIAMQDITKQKVLRDRLSFLARTSKLVGASLDFRTTLEDVASAAVPSIADWCAVDLIDGEGGVGDYVAATHRDKTKVELVRELRRRFPPRPEAPSGIAAVLRTGEPFLSSRIDEDSLREAELPDDHRDTLLELKIRSYLCVPIVESGRVTGAISMAQAESGRTFDDEDLELAMEFSRRTAIAIENARLHDESERAVQLRDQILGIVSHDLRNPIGTIDLATSLLFAKGIGDEPEYAKHVETIQRAARRATRLINDLLDVSSIQSGHLSFELTACPLHAIIEETLEGTLPVAHDRGIALQSELNVSTEKVRCDRQRLQQALANLIGNAIKFGRDGGAVTIRAHRRDHEVLVSVCDRGPGISPDEVAHVFDLYWKGRRDGSGTGLGLFITKGIIESHGGRIWVDSEVGTGSTFHVALPIAN